MSQLLVNNGTIAGDGTGENLHNAFGKLNANDAELYGAKTEFYANLAALPVTGVAGKIYVTLDTGKLYRWTGSAYLEISPETSNSVANGKTGATSFPTGQVLYGNGTGALQSSANVIYNPLDTAIRSCR